ncbi:cobaltochelatase subunit CobN [Paenibacillus ginsengarvi]|uniref:Cobaltochelatase subunit CobN n=1 Tax=Paenibacillus ginsengarvi TaxID=400777 RepID=A0A3B0CK96_9BACL|nr:cobaltochelatase subunit CobN [Paenibacillus ginsengarvi]RKN84426.1 cobaltochelatase subunit CobN [Paenibacillus ginsengarvi]
MKITVLTSSETARAHLAEAYGQLGERGCTDLELSIIILEQRQPIPEPLLKQAIRDADMLLIDAHGARKPAIDTVKRLVSGITAHIVPVGSDSADIRSLLRLGGLTADRLPDGFESRKEHTFVSGQNEHFAHFVRITDYWRGGGTANMLALLAFCGREYGRLAGLPEPADPLLFKELGIIGLADRTVYTSAEAYFGSRTSVGRRPVVAMFFPGNGNPDEVLACIGQIAERIEAYADVLPVAFPSVMNMPFRSLRELLIGGGRAVNLIVSFLPFRLGSGPVGDGGDEAKKLLEQLGVPVLHPFFLSGSTEVEWTDSVRGLTPSQLLVQVMLPELDGCIETYPVAALRREPGSGDGAEGGLPRLALLAERADRLAGRVRRWLELQAKANRDKKLALIGYNYPPGEAGVFGAAFLDTFESISRIISRLKQEGYDVEEMTAQQLRHSLVEEGVVNSGRWSGESAAERMILYANPEFAGKLGRKRWGAEAVERWGAPPGDLMTADGDFLIPGIVNKNVFIGLQPTRAIHESSGEALHDRSLLPHHQYTAFYEWIREEWNADALVHIGTHGTLEFQRGKEAGLSGDCVPDDMVGDLPHLYLYYVGNPSEAVIAKRRSHAVLIGYQAPPFTDAGLYGDWLELEVLLHEYREAERLDPERCDDVKRRLLDKARALDWSATGPDELEEELYRMKRSLIPGGLHRFGEAYSPDEAAAYMNYVLRHERGHIRSVHALLAERQGSLPEEAAAPPQELDREAEAIVRAYARDQTLLEQYLQESAEWQTALLSVLEYGLSAYRASMASEEMEGLLKALGGSYIPARLAGDVIRSPEVLPAGSNLYQFDPRSVPSATAFKRGAEAAENSIRRYYDTHGRYPDTTAVVLWGLETSRTQGETIGQIMHYLGVKPAGSGAFRTGYDIVSLEELGRPRLNVVVQITGIFRDMFPSVLDDLNRLFRRVSELEELEEMNAFKSRSAQAAAELSGSGYSDADIRELASARIFGPAEGEYGTTVTRLIETKRWSDENELGSAFADSQQHLYSLNRRGVAEPGLLNSHLKAVDIVSQIRSSHEYEVTDSDHYFEYFGGLSKAVEMAKGSRADIHITDSAGERVKTELAEHVIARGVRTRLMNPKWIDALLAHPYHGAQHIAKRFDNILGLAATTGKVEDWVFDRLHDVYVADELRSRQMELNNKWAYHAMIESLLESEQRGYWRPDEDTLEKLRSKYAETEGHLE